ncbi:hypothetical protein DSL64_26725 [Dyadobacter luteus]|uniref:C1q domain-containing protein n=1 Tax=Dyadobacter luteus TaxID=2259619 RepID=A0A3D8Y4M3_9BACT|nr:hypothetical protein [Dyadobacter luteus]REA56515.1 hypothetical protein DSL64_26725 [Dyadobacter luteus]
MKIKHIFLTSLVALLSTTFSFAQVKIGTNPTAIEATSNLEVEASTANRQFKVNRTSGQVTIKDGTEGLGKVLTSDANGNASWTNLTSAFRMTSIFSSTPPYYENAGDPTIYRLIPAQTVVIDQDGGCTSGANPKYTVVQPGTYTIMGGVTMFPQYENTAASLRIYKNGNVLKTVGSTQWMGQVGAMEITVVDVAAVGDVYELRLNNNKNWMRLYEADFSGTRIK